jgi:hypothetical protein
VKTNSEGEFVFDHAWARFCETRLERPYFPKLVLAVPFTPATGSRLLIAGGRSPAAVAPLVRSALVQIGERLGLSGAHVLFPTAAEATALADSGMLLRYGLQFHWQNAGYTSFDDFLSRFSAKRRHQIRRERRELAEQGISLQSLTGAELTPEIVDFVYRFYRSTVDKFYWGRRYLNRAFFEEICARLGDALHVVVARPGKQQAPIAGALNLVGSDALYGRYWGALQERPFMHFNVCYYQGIEHCIERGLRLFEPGAGGEHKLARGFRPCLTYSAHHLAEPMLEAAIADFCRRERLAVLEHVAEDERSPVLRQR